MVPPNRFRLSASPFERPLSKTEDAKSVLFLSVEGTETEVDYFTHLNASLSQDSPFVIHVLRHSRDTDADPRHVLALLEECRAIRTGKSFFPPKIGNRSFRLTEKQVKAYFDHPDTLTKKERDAFKTAVAKLCIDIDYYRYIRQIGRRKNLGEDHFALVLDRDGKCHDLATLIEIRNVCRKKHFEFCLSNPCFDLWLLLHLECRLTKQIKNHLSQNDRVSNTNTYSSSLLSKYAHHGKQINQSVFSKHYLPKIRFACKRAATLATSDIEILSNLGSRVFLIIDLLKSKKTS